MKRLVAVSVFVLCASLLFAVDDKGKNKDKGKGGDMMEATGTICYAKCVKEEGGRSVCDQSCKETSGDMVFIDDQGKKTKIANPKSVKPGMMSKPVKVKAKMKGDMMQMYDVVLANAAGG